MTARKSDLAFPITDGRIAYDGDRKKILSGTRYHERAFTQSGLNGLCSETNSSNQRRRRSARAPRPSTASEAGAGMITSWT